MTSLPVSGRPRLRPSWWELLPALPLLVMGLFGTSRAADQQDWARSLDLGAYALVVAAALALLLRRRAPVTGLVLCGLAISVYLAVRYPYGPILLCGPAAAYAVAARLPWRAAVGWIAAFTLVTGVAPMLGRSPDEGWLTHVAWLGAWSAAVSGVAAVGAAVQVRRRSEAGVRAEQARRAVSEERLQMAQDVHDGVGHALAVIALHSGVALHVLERDPDRARELLDSIQATSRDALEGLRADLDRLRSPEGMASRRPVPVLEDLPVLLARMREGGLVLHERVEPCPDVPEELAATAYRIVQESLTNVLRHAGDTPAWVHVTCRSGTLVVDVRDRGPAAPDPTAVAMGSGISGMRRRAEAVGGRLTAGPGPDGGFVVHAELPLPVAGPARPADPAVLRNGAPP